MNNQIETLAKQAAEYAIEFAAKDQELYIPKLMEKFAELIVKECAYVADKNQAEDMNWPIGNILKEHFGVEE